jgi:hypothetical protein
MTEADWQAGADPAPLLEYLGARATPRKLRLFAFALCRRRLGLVSNRHARTALEVCERFADGLADDRELAAAAESAVNLDESYFLMPMYQAVVESVRADVAEAVQGVLLNLVQLAQREAAYECAPGSDERAEVAAAIALERRRQADVLREMFGNPFRPVSLNPDWLRWNDACVRRLAEVFYRERRFADLPILADALEDAGCSQHSLLAHCRTQEGHEAGCWALDLLPAREDRPPRRPYSLQALCSLYNVSR